MANVDGGTQLDVVEGTDAGSSGSVWALDGTTGATLWHQPAVGRVIASVVAADLTGAGYQDLLVPTVHGVEVLDGRSGAEVTVLGSKFGFQNAPLVTDDPNGMVGVTIAGYNGANQGVVQHYEIPGSNGASAVGQGAWPMFHHDAGLTGASSVLPDLGRVTPTALTAQRGNAEVSLSWSSPPSASGAPASGYNVYESTVPGHEPSTPINGSSPVTSTSYAVTGLANGTKYYFEVTALNSAGEGAPSNEASAVPAAAPAAPTSVSAVAGNAEVSLSWVRPPSNGGTAVTTYNVYQSTSAGAQGAQVAQVAGTAYTATGLRNGGTYYFEITAVSSVGEGAPSVQVTATPVAPVPTTSATAPGPPGNLLATTGNALVSLSWSPPPNGGPAATSYNVYLSTSAGLQGTKIAQVPGTTFTATGLQDGTTYYFEVTGVDAAGEGVASAQVAAAPAPPGYRVAGSNGQVFALGKLPSLPSQHPASPVVAMASTPDAYGYWLVLKNGSVLRAGDARLYGSMAGKHLNSRIAGIAATPDGRGYWLVAADGGIFAFGDAHYYGSLGARPLNRPIAAIAATPDGRGYWLVASDGGIFAFGDAHFFGSMGAKHLNETIVAIAATPDGRGYWLVASDGGIFAFGDATFYGSMGSRRLNRPIVGMAATANGRGYWMVAADGGVFGFGNASFFGALGGRAQHVKVVGIAP